MTTLDSALLSLKRFAYTHDDLPAFRAGYLVLTVIIASLFHLGAFLLLILAHVSLDLVKYREYHGYSWRRTGEGILRESLFDVTLLAIGFVFAMYFHHTIGIAGVSGILRADITVIRGLGTLIPKAEILNDFFHLLSRLWMYLRFPHTRLGLLWDSGEKLCFFFVATSLILLVIAPAVLGIGEDQYFAALAREIVPW